MTLPIASVNEKYEKIRGKYMSDIRSQISANDKEETNRQLSFITKAGEYVKDLEEKICRKPKACVTNFGCQMNARDSEKLRGMLRGMGYDITDDENDAEFVAYNTCTVRDNADKRVFGRLGYLGAMKEHKPYMRIALCGCMMQEPAVIDKLKKSYRFVDLVFGTFNLFKFPELVCDMFESDRPIIDIWEKTDEIVEDLPIERKYRFKSGVNIMYGCNNFCSYCIVPYVRGRERSRAPQDIIEEIKRLAQDGVIEIMLLGQNVNSYGNNTEGGISFARLLKKAAEVDGIERVRFMTSHPKDLSQELIDTMASDKKICRHLHLPVQSGSDRILKSMNRRYTSSQYIELTERIKDAIPDIALSTDIIVGFPGETDEDVDRTIELVKHVGFDNAFTFEYSRRTGTPAAAMSDQVEPSKVKYNFERLLKVVQDTGKDQVAKMTGRTEKILVEEVNEKDPSLVTGRTDNNTVVHFPGDRSMIGTMQTVLLDKCCGFYFIGKKIQDLR